MLRHMCAYIFSFFLLVSAASPVLAASESITVFAAASLREVLEEAGKSFTASGGPEVKFSFASSSAIAKQIEAGAPADLFASADLKWMDYVTDKKLIQADTRVNLLGNTLVIVAPASSSLDRLPLTTEAIAKALGDGRITTGEVNSVPVGIYAKAASQKLGIWDVIEKHLAQAENVRAALKFVALGEAPLGIVYSTDAKAEKAVKVVAIFPEDSHDPIIYPFAVTTAAKGDGAKKFLEYLKTPAATAIFENAGFPILVRQSQ
ncbi:MAG: molybdate ABC transporter substrate-binding protein [Pseudomonadota bacterium]